MKQYIKIEMRMLLGYNMYVSYENTCGDDNYLYSLFWALKEFYYEDEFIDFLDNPELEDVGSNEGDMEKVGNMIEIYTPGDNLNTRSTIEPVPSAIISIENLKVITRDWKKLYGNKVPVIYLILQDDGWIVVRETLDDE